MQRLQDPNQSNVNNVRRKRERNTSKMDELETGSKIKRIRDLYRGFSDFNTGYQPRTNTIKDEKGDLVTDSCSILARWRKHFTQLLNVHGVNDVGQTEIRNSRAKCL